MRFSDHGPHKTLIHVLDIVTQFHELLLLLGEIEDEHCGKGDIRGGIVYRSTQTVAFYATCPDLHNMLEFTADIDGSNLINGHVYEMVGFGAFTEFHADKEN